MDSPPAFGHPLSFEKRGGRLAGTKLAIGAVSKVIFFWFSLIPQIFADELID
jgi:hypothetical protein